MALFPHLEIEDKLQVNDKTRLDGTKSFVSKGGDAITDVTVQPGADGSAITVFDTSSDNWFLDWEFKTFSGDFDATNNKLDFKEAAGELTATITAATYTLSALATEIETQLNAVAVSNTYTVTVSKDNKVTISADGNFSLLPNEGTNSNTSILPIIGISSKPGFDDSAFANETTVTGEVVRWLPKAVVLELDDSTITSAETVYFKLYDEDGDALFSDDGDLVRYKADILKWVRPGRSSFKDYHRAAQEVILEFLRESGYVDLDGNPLKLKSLVFKDDVRRWSTFVTLRLIMTDLTNDVDDIFSRELSRFSSREEKARNMVFLRIDIDNDGKAEIGEGIKVRSGRMIRV